ncbi:MAG: arginine--tRNA ligase [Coriobacteriia bacterium]|nr:arginine--tRNA ligase [Coriobacteriia bacterium]
MLIREQLEQLIDAALRAAIADGTLAMEAVPEAALERPRDEANGDWASTVAMRSAKLAHRSPRDVAQAIVDHLPENAVISSVEIAGPGFINIRLCNAALQGVIRDVRAAKGDFGKGAAGEHNRVNLEYVSANPTGPMHVGHGRWAALGDSLGRVMRHAGYDVYEEFYVNDHGVQMDVFGNSIVVRYRQLLGESVELPEKAYGGAYVTDIAQALVDRDGGKWLDTDPQKRHETFREFGYEMMLKRVQNTLEGFGNHFDCYFSERSLYVPGPDGTNAVDRALAAFREAGHIYEHDGATWFRSTTFGDDKDRVLIKENGEMTYFMSDCAYHYDKLQRGFDHLINIWGADHHGYVKRCEAMLEAWGRPNTLEVVLGQLVNLFRNGEAVRMSKRTGEMVTFEELIDEVGVDATRFLMLSRSSDQPIDFDIEAAKKQDASNPVYYVQYAHARICSILRKAAGVEEGETDALAAQLVPAEADLSALEHPTELALMRKMADFPDFIALAARDRAPFRCTHYAQELAGLFHQFYTNCHVICEDAALQTARLALCDATRKVLALTLDLLGVSAPQKM